MNHRTQGAAIVAALLKRPMTYLEMLALGVSCSPWKRAAEALALRPDLKLQKGRNRRGLTTWAVKRVSC